MKALVVTTFILLGGVWIFYATIVPSVMRVRAMSDAMAFQAALHRWASEKVVDGRLNEDDVKQIFPESYSLGIGGENSDHDFLAMIEHIAESSAPPVWPGAIMCAVGIAAAFRLPSTAIAEQVGAANRDKAGGCSQDH
ncbi:hypothetical protein [Sulfuriroseicoccus oceanibius]|uniref:Uncharacterized protein n=1 Tax=Sulfuriroseicoccus oceanibius TaxID=2707525 RepID=A0A6B3LBJ7_9BACT|nr:hypothetical protein [Sulfuriroseicoccus oceanibius]QQL44086.1 hypothetical protein G3M56_009285 [Sulfuriroseicoccus oceanibius]